MQCQICSSEECIKVISLGHQPPSDEFIVPEKKNTPFHAYPLDLYYCKQCHLAQLGYAVDPTVLFSADDYVYNTGSNAGLKRHFHELAQMLIKRFDLGASDLVMDIGSNDGTLLEGYGNSVQVLGVDPSSVAKMAIEKGIPTIVDLFNEETARTIREKNPAAKIVTAMNVFAHVEELDSFVRGIKALLSDDGVFISESHHLLDMMQKMQYDAIYHEHLRYYSLKPLQHLFEKHGMEIIDVEKVSTHGGSIRVYAANKDAYAVEPAVDAMIAEETRAGLYDEATYHQFARRLIRSKHRLLSLLISLREKGARVVGIGAPAKGNTLLNFCQIRGDLISYLAEHSDLKIGKLAPGSLIPVVDEKRVFEEQPEYALLLSWNLRDIIVPKLRSKGYKGTFIIPGERPELD